MQWPLLFPYVYEMKVYNLIENVYQRGTVINLNYENNDIKIINQSKYKLTARKENLSMSTYLIIANPLHK